MTELLVGTKRGLFVLEGEPGGAFEVKARAFAGEPVEYAMRDPRTGRFCYGDRPTIADICLVAHLTSAKMLCDSDPAPYPTARRILDACMQIDAFASEHPLRQAGAQTAAPI